jgi:adenylate kinase family enzyme
MAAKLFVLGRPGSGKTTIVRHITGHVKQLYEKWSVVHIADYVILYKMFQTEARTKYERFRPVKLEELDIEGFDVTDFSVLDEALEELSRQVQVYAPSANKADLILIEFARDDYSKAFKQLDQLNINLQDAYILFVEADLETCIQRIHERVAHPLTQYDHFVSEDILRSYYGKDNRKYMSSNFKKDYRVNDQRVMIIDNPGQFEDIVERINHFIDSILQQESDNSSTSNAYGK